MTSTVRITSDSAVAVQRLPDHLERRAANEAIRQEAKLAKAKDRSSARSAGAGREALSRALKRHPNNPKAQVAMFFGDFVIKSGTGRQRPVSECTSDAYSDGLIRMIDDLRVNQAAIRNLSELGKAHALRLIKYWVSEEQSPATVQNKISVLRRFLTFIGKENIIPKHQELRTWLFSEGINPPEHRQGVAVQSKAWDEKGIDLQSILERVRLECPITAMQLELQAAFGLRMRESLQLDPRGADYGDFLRVVYGTKGGLPRDVPFDADPSINAWQRDVIERAKEMAKSHPKGRLAKKGKTLEQNVEHFYYRLKRAGITQRELGVTAHGLRHQYAAQRYRHLTGHGAPVSRNAPQEITEQVKQNDLQARRKVALELGHFRDSVSKAYIGSLPMLSRSRKKRIGEWIERTEGNTAFQKALANAGIRETWIAGNAAMGNEMAEKDKLRLVVRTKDNQPMPQVVHTDLLSDLQEIYQAGVDLSERFIAGSPDNALEITLTQSDAEADR
jgi:site-specific recombinase XerD